MELNVSYVIPKPEEAWREVKKVLRPDSVHVASYVATGHSYDDKKTMLNVTSRMKETRSSFYVICNIEQVSDITAHAEEVCNLNPYFKYNTVVEHCNRTAQLRFVIEIGPGLLNHKLHESRTYRLPEDISVSHQERVLRSSMRQEVCLLVGDKAFNDLVNITKDQARYVVAFTSDNSDVVTICGKKGLTIKREIRQ
ncbi:hypothetical protein KAR91_50140 [Candidatus Pacearchaeota archaeon]|nr:hypothetical protein [Candidatus Pacearchaeota archaeon]